MMKIQLVATDLATGKLIAIKGEWLQTGDTPNWNQISMMIRDEITPDDELEFDDDVDDSL